MSGVKTKLRIVAGTTLALAVVVVALILVHGADGRNSPLYVEVTLARAYRDLLADRGGTQQVVRAVSARPRVLHVPNGHLSTRLEDYSIVLNRGKFPEIGRSAVALFTEIREGVFLLVDARGSCYVYDAMTTEIRWIAPTHWLAGC